MDYVSRMVYNKDKDLVFVYRPDGLWNETEYVYEMHHLEQVVPSPVTAIKDLTMNRKDGIINVHCMNTKEYLKFYGEDKYWNVEHKEDFLSQTRSLWLNNTDKYQGRIFNISSRDPPHAELMVLILSLIFIHFFRFKKFRLSFRRLSKSMEKFSHQNLTRTNSLKESTVRRKILLLKFEKLRSSSLDLLSKIDRTVPL